ncbi:LysM peptidoglycan-binding domain-containing protein [Robertkochia aurantiaca]|uniref:LysM peptidoglycan-binding domain-containing protein n=1 Tax=Robertkochia aurantiaca TaxID=2873700 RepID=UPI001CCC6A88|nr:LysM peptidoglycan-binding domain-containing protein [Robertkochia sp. 3YJGBD-33]
MKKGLLITIALITLNSFAQQKKETVIGEAEPKEIVEADSDKNTEIIQNAVDSVAAMADSLLIRKVNGKYLLEDNPLARKMDSLWLQEIYGSGLFDTLYTDISEMKFDDVEYAELHTDTLKKRLELLDQKTPFHISYNPSLESVIKMFLTKRKNYLNRVMTLSKYYFPLFEEQLDKHNIPLEIKYLAIVESALNPRARSRVGATGLWQFMFTTGKMYDLDVSSYVDERSDPVKSTEAACEFLGRLYTMFGDWDLALAAYNSGPGNVSKAIRRSGGYENYWNIRPFLPRETAGYVPAFLAVMYLFEYAEEHGFDTYNPRTSMLETDTVQVKKLITFDQISELLDVEVEEIQFFNPAYKLDIIPYDEKEKYTLRLPKHHIGRFVNNEKEIYAFVEEEMKKREKPLPELLKTDSRIRYRVVSGDYLGRIADKFGVRISDIKRWNGLRSNNIRAGQRLTIYPRKPVLPQKKNTSAEASVSSSAKEYTVQRGDSLWKIANRHPGISIENIKDWNDIRSDNLKPGTKLKLCKC